MSTSHPTTPTTSAVTSSCLDSCTPQFLEQRLVSSGSNVNGVNDVFVADVNGDGLLDVVSASTIGNMVTLHQQGANNTFTDQVITNQADRARSVVVTDIDNSGSQDIVFAALNDDIVGFFRNVGNFFLANVISVRAFEVIDVAVADFENDADIDVVAALRDVGDIILYRQEPFGSFQEVVVSDSVPGVFSVAVGDMNGDGLLDVVAAGSTLNEFVLLQQTGSLTFSQTTIGTATTPRDAVLADIDGDGDLDVVGASSGDGSLRWFQNNLPSAWSENLISASVPNAFKLSVQDINADGSPDVVLVQSNSNTATVFFNNGLGIFPSPMVLSTGLSNVRGVFTADVDSDGDMDIVTASQNSDRVDWFVNECCSPVEDMGTCDGTQCGAIAFNPVMVSMSNDRPTSVVPCDLNNDGDLDLIVTSVSLCALYLLLCIISLNCIAAW